MHSKISEVDGILNIDKPAGLTSHDVVARVRRILKTKRVGHTGTLDPFATGVMVVLVGQATRLAQFLDKDEKEYEAVLRFGFETDTGDKMGMQNAECTIQNTEIGEILESTDWNATLAAFRGEIDQIPPMFSAKKIDGKKLYEHARKGVEVERKVVKINISTLEVIDNGLKAENLEHGAWTLKIHVVCSAGTYVRQLAVDIGRKIGVGAHLTELRRTRAGRFDLSRSVTLDALQEMEDVTTALLPVETAISHLRSITLESDRVGKTKSGLSTRVAETGFKNEEPIGMFEPGGNVIAVGIYNETEKSVQPKVVLG